MPAPVSASWASAAVANGVAPVTVTKPTGVASGDLLVGFCWANNAASTWSAPSSPAWTSVNSNSAIGIALFSRVADGTEGADFTFTRAASTSGTAGVIMVRVTGAGTVQQGSMKSATTSATIDLNTVTAANADTLLLQMVSTHATTADSWSPPATATERVDTTASGTAVRYAVGDEVVGSGATGIRTWTHALVTSCRGAMWAINPSAGATNLVVDAAAQTQTADSPALTQTHVLAVDPATHAQAADSPALTQVHNLAVDAGAQAQSADSPTLTQVHVLEVADGQHVQVAETPTLTQVHQLAVDPSVHAQAATEAALTQVHVLTVDSAVHAQTSDSPTLTTAPARNVTVTAALSPPRLTAALEATPYAADTLPARRSAQVAAPRRTADTAPARRTARIEAT